MVTGESVTLEEMGGADLHARVSGLADLMVATEPEAIDAVRLYLSYLPANWEQQPPTAASRPPRDVGPLRDVVPANEATPYDVHQLIDGIVDADSFFEHKELFAPELVTGFARIDGSPVGIVANQSSVKGASAFAGRRVVVRTDLPARARPHRAQRTVRAAGEDQSAGRSLGVATVHLEVRRRRASQRLAFVRHQNGARFFEFQRISAREHV